MTSDFAPEVAKYLQSSSNFGNVRVYCFAPLAMHLVSVFTYRVLADRRGAGLTTDFHANELCLFTLALRPLFCKSNLHPSITYHAMYIYFVLFVSDLKTARTTK